MAPAKRAWGRDSVGSLPPRHPLRRGIGELVPMLGDRGVVRHDECIANGQVAGCAVDADQAPFGNDLCRDPCSHDRGDRRLPPLAANRWPGQAGRGPWRYSVAVLTPAGGLRVNFCTAWWYFILRSGRVLSAPGKRPDEVVHPSQAGHVRRIEWAVSYPERPAPKGARPSAWRSHRLPPDIHHVVVEPLSHGLPHTFEIPPIDIRRGNL
jgi:hypothetical protein